MLRLFHSPFACSLACRFALAEVDVEHELVVIRLSEGANQSADYASINPWRKVPALQTPDGVLTENIAILPYIAEMDPQRKLLPQGTSFERARLQAMLGAISSSLHPCFTGVIRPERFTTDPAGQDSVRAAYLDRLITTLTQFESQLGEQHYLLGDYTICDLYLLVFLLYRNSPSVAGKLPEFPRLSALQTRLLTRPALAKTLADEQRLFASKTS